MPKAAPIKHVAGMLSAEPAQLPAASRQHAGIRLNPTESESIRPNPTFECDP